MSIGQAVGTVIGFFVGGPKGAYWGYMAGSIIDPPPGPHTEGPRLTDRVVQTSEEGAPLPTIFGTVRIAGNVIWSSGLEEIKHKEESGGGSGGGGATSTTYTYRTDAAIALCVGEIAGVRRIWADTKLIYDRGATDANALVASSGHAAGIRVYLGSEAQDADPLIQAIEGASNTPAFRGIAYAVFEDLHLADFGNRLPNFSFEVVKKSAGATSGLLPAVSIQSRDYYNWVEYARNGEFRCAATPELMDLGHSYLSSTYRVNRYDAVSGAFIGSEEAYNDATYPANAYWTGGTNFRTNSDTASAMSGGQNYNGLIVSVDGDPRLVGSTSAIMASALFGNRLFWFVYADNCALRTALLSSTTMPPTTTPYSEIPGIVSTYYGTSYYNQFAVTDSYVWVSPRSSGYLYRVDPVALTYTRLDAIYTGANNAVFFPVADNEVLILTNTAGTNWRIGVSLNDAAETTLVASTTLAQTINDLRRYGQAQKLGDNLYSIYAGKILHIYTGVMAQASETLQSVATVLLDQSGLNAAEYDITALSADVVRGYLVGRPMATRDALEPLQTAYHFDLSERDGKIYAIKRGGAVVATIPEDDLGAAENPDGVKLKLTRHNEGELPSEIQISYSDINNDHQAGTQYARSLTAQVTNIKQISLPLSMTSQEAAQLAEVILNASRYTGRHTLQFSLGYAWSRLAPADVVSLPGYGVQWTARIGQVDLGMPGLVQFQASPEIAALYASILAGSDPAGIGQTIGLAGITTLNLLDCCLLRDTDDSLGWYVALTGSVDTWPGGALYKSNDGGSTWVFAASATRTQGATLGAAAAALANTDCRVWDKTNTISVQLQADATLSSTTETNLLAGANSALLGAAGRWELIQFLTATLETDGSYTLRDLLRGRKGTEHAAASHAAGDTFILLDSNTLQDLPAASAELNAAREYKALTLGQALEAVSAESLTYTGERLRCLSPVELGGGRDASGNLTLAWKRRDRLNHGWNDYADIPMSEASQAYEVDIYDSTYATLKRTLTGLTSATASYTSADQTTDFGSNQATVYARIYQLSATTGRGHYLQGSI